MRGKDERDDEKKRKSDGRGGVDRLRRSAFRKRQPNERRERLFSRVCRNRRRLIA